MTKMKHNIRIKKEEILHVEKREKKIKYIMLPN